MTPSELNRQLAALTRSLLRSSQPFEFRWRIVETAWRIERRRRPERVNWTALPTVDRLSPESLAAAWRLSCAGPDCISYRPGLKGFVADYADYAEPSRRPRYRGLNKLARIDSFADAYRN